MTHRPHPPAPAPASRSGLIWAVVLGLVAFVAVSAVIAVRDAHVPAAEVLTPEEAMPENIGEFDEEYRFENVNWPVALACGGLAGGFVALAATTIRRAVSSGSGRPRRR